MPGPDQGKRKTAPFKFNHLIDLECAVNDAADMARVTVEYIGQVLDFDRLEARPLDKQESHILLFLVTHTMALAEQAKAAFYGKDTDAD